MAIYGVLATVTLIFIVLALWQRRIDRRERGRVVEEIRDARARGADRAIAQYPQIDALSCIGCSSCIRACPENGVLGLVDGVAHVIQASRCVGHGRCEEACPVNALKVGLGDVSRRPDLPRLSDELESSVPGVFIAGELGGMALIGNAVEQGVRAVEAIARRLEGTPPVRGAADLLVVGSGPAGLAATLKAVELGLRYVTIDQSDLGGTVRKYPRRKLVMTRPVTLPLHGRLRRSEYRKEELIDLWRGIVRDSGAEVRTGVRLLGLDRRDGLLLAETSAGPVASRTVVLALGRRGTPRRLGVPGEEQERVLYQLIDAASYTGQRLLVVGGGDSAIEAAMALAEQPGNEVTLSYRKEGFFRLKPRNEDRIHRFADEGRVRLLFRSTVQAFGRDHADLACGTDALRLGNDYAFVFAGGDPPYPLLKRAGVRFWAEEVAA